MRATPYRGLTMLQAAAEISELMLFSPYSAAEDYHFVCYINAFNDLHVLSAYRKSQFSWIINLNTQPATWFSSFLSKHTPSVLPTTLQYIFPSTSYYHRGFPKTLSLDPLEFFIYTSSLGNLITSHGFQYDH